MQHRPGVGENHKPLHRHPLQAGFPQMMPHIVHMGFVLQLGIVQPVGFGAHNLPELPAVSGDFSSHMLGFHHQHPEAAEQQVVDFTGVLVQGQVHIAAYPPSMLPGKPAQLCRHQPFAFSAPALGKPVSQPQQQKQPQKPCGNPDTAIEYGHKPTPFRFRQLPQSTPGGAGGLP